MKGPIRRHGLGRWLAASILVLALIAFVFSFYVGVLLYVGIVLLLISVGTGVEREHRQFTDIQQEIQLLMIMRDDEPKHGARS